MGRSVLVMIKPDALNRVDVEILADFAEAGFMIKDIYRSVLTKEQAEALYEEHKNKSHFNDLVTYTISGKVTIAWMVRDDAVAVAREMIGEANPDKRKPGTLRAKYALDYRRNSVHGSDSDDAARREIKLFFGDKYK